MRQQAGGRKQQAVCELALGIPWAYPKAGRRAGRQEAAGRRQQEAAGRQEEASSRQQMWIGPGHTLGIPKSRRRQAAAAGRRAGSRRQAGSMQQAADSMWIGPDYTELIPWHTQNQEEAGRQEEAGSGQEAAGGWQAGGSRRRQMYPPVWHRINLPSSLVATWDLFLGAEGVA